MMKLFNPIDYPGMFNLPARLTPYSYWREHIPFGMFLVQLLRPRLLVELGTHYGDSYCAFCQTVKELGLDTRCYAVDNWQGDAHIPTYGQDVLSGLRAHHDPLYGGFSTLVQSDFDAALQYFQDGTIDLLHLDGTHTYRAVKRDFYTWLPKLSSRGVVLFHDTNVLDRGYGVRQFFDEIKTGYPHFEFTHGYGLGILAVGPEQPDPFRSLLLANEEETAAIRKFFFSLGQRVRLSSQVEELQATKHSLEEQLAAREHSLHAMEQAVAERENAMGALYNQLTLITDSSGYKVLDTIWKLRSQFKSVRQPAAAPAESEPNHLPSEPVAEAAPTAVEIPTANAAPAALLPLYSQEELQSQVSQICENLDAVKAADLRAIAFYLPQFHPIPENDLWWGKGFTEWRNVTRARPNFSGHRQPLLPADLGYYDLRLSDIREEQARLAREYGISGFCYHHYWFGGQRLLERPFNEILESGRPDFPFCLCWANENWTRRWDGAEHEILIAQNHSEEDDRNFIRSLFPAFADKRYIRIDGRPLLIVYRADILPEAARTADRWREEMHRAGMGEIYLCAAQSFGIGDPEPYGFDAAVEFPPHGVDAPDLASAIEKLNPNYTGKVYDYLTAAESMIRKPPPDYALFKAAMPGWDNTARRQNHGNVFINSSPLAYEYWLGRAVELTARRHRGDERLVFINAWNEWGEGAYLEPDQETGYEILKATREILDAARGKA